MLKIFKSQQESEKTPTRAKKESKHRLSQILAKMKPQKCLVKENEENSNP